MKKLILILLAAAMVFSLAACGEDKDNNTPSGNTPGTSQNGNNNTPSGSDGAYPRFTGHDGVKGEEVLALLQNAHIKYSTNEYPDMSERARDGEWMVCLNRYYSKRFTHYGYERNVKGDTEYPLEDYHQAIVIDGDKVIVYDFARKIIAEGELKYSGVTSDWLFDTPMTQSTINYWFANYKNFEPDNVPNVFVNELASVAERTITGKQCKGVLETTTNISVANGKPTYEYQCWTDPATELTLRLEWYNSHYSLDEMSSWFEVKEIGINTVTPADVDKKIAEVLNGQQDKYQKMTYSDYLELLG
jgi:predicted small lipoprotein YifL